ncbi:MAG: endonuclease III [Actinobacteria bacterium]|nr:endonuclease III [Actinomycetota bacterium]
MTPRVDRGGAPRDRAREVMKRLEKAYPDAAISLDYDTPLECVVAVILSAQSTDARVNLVTPGLFAKYRAPEDYLAVPEEELQRDIQSTGFFRQKTRALRGMAQKLIDDFNGEVPKTMAELITLPGVARKTANVVQNNLFPEVAKKDPDAGIAVDTHVGRVAVRLGLTTWDSKDAVRIEADLKELVPRSSWYRITDLFIEHGRTICDAKKPLCGDCPVEDLCPSSQVAGMPDLYRVTAKKKTTAAKKTTARKKR